MSRATCLALLASAACLQAPPGAEPDAGGAVSSPDAAPDAALVIDRRSCASILSSWPGVKEGPQLIDPDGDGGAEPFEVYCDMTIEGGGWMLVARSAGIDDDVPFGWLYDNGTVNAADGPYSLSVDRPGLTFTELLVGSRGAKKEWGANVYRIGLPEGFIDDYMASAVDTDPATVVGDCAVGGGPAMLSFVGHTDAIGHFYMRDVTADENFGFFPSGFALSATPCETSGGLHGEHGMLFVR